MKAALYCCFPCKEFDCPDILEQELILVNLMQHVNGELYAIYVDKGLEASLMPKASFLQMVQDGKTHLFDVLLCIHPRMLDECGDLELTSLITIFPPETGTHSLSSHTIKL